MAKFEPGQSGNPSGRPPGSRNKTAVLFEERLAEDAEAIVRKILDLAKGGDSACLKLCADRLMPARRDRHVPFQIPTMKTAADAVRAAAAITDAVAAGELTPMEAAELSKVLDSFAKILHVADLETRLERLEKEMAR